MSLGPIVGVGGPGVARIVAEIDDDVETDLEVREDRSPAQRTAQPEDDGWDGQPAGRISTERRGRVHRITVSGLDPDTSYRYRFVDTARGDPIPGFGGRFSPVPDQTARPIGFVLLSCNKHFAYDDIVWYDKMWSDLAGYVDDHPEVRFIIHAGDQVYCDHAWNSAFEEQREALRNSVRTEEWFLRRKALWSRRYRDLYREAWNREPVKRVLRSIPNIMMWDDHDIHDGYGSRTTDFYGWAQHAKEVATQVFSDYQASLNPDPNLGDACFGFVSQLLGCRFVVLDGRSHRDCRAPQVLGASQWNGLLASVEQHLSDPKPLFLVSGTPLFNFALSHRTTLRRLSERLGDIIADIQDDLRDAWDSTKNSAELMELLDLLERMKRETALPVVALAGDIHVQHLTSWTRAQERAPRIHQVTSSPLTNQPLGKVGLRLAYQDPPYERGAVPFLEDAFRARVDWLANRRGYAAITVHSASGAHRVHVTMRTEPPGNGPTMQEERFKLTEEGWEEV